MMFKYGTSIVKGWFDDDPNYFSGGLKVVKTISPTIFCEQLWPGIMISIQFRLFFLIKLKPPSSGGFGLERNHGVAGCCFQASSSMVCLLLMCCSWWAFDWKHQHIGIWLPMQCLCSLPLGIFDHYWCHPVGNHRDTQWVVQARSVYGRRSSRFRFEAGGWEGGMLGHLTALWIPFDPLISLIFLSFSIGPSRSVGPKHSQTKPWLANLSILGWVVLVFNRGGGRLSLAHLQLGYRGILY